MNNFFETKLHDVVKIAPKMLTNKFNENILSTLKYKYEGICSKFGYIKHNSIQLKKINMGKIEMSTFHGYVLFDVEFIAKICNPAIGSIIRCTVKNTNSFGILCTSGIYENNRYHNVLNVVVPKIQDSTNIEKLNQLSVNDEVNIEILGKKYLLNNESIHIFGKVIDDSVATAFSAINLDYSEDQAEIESVIEDNLNEGEDEPDVELEEEEIDEQDEKESFIIDQEDDLDADLSEDDIDDMSDDELND